MLVCKYKLYTYICMKIFYTASFYGKSKYQREYDLVLKTIQKYSTDIISTELGNYLKLIDDKEKRKIKDLHKIHYEAIKKGISLADIVIMEISNPDFQLGHEATLAINNKKPVLCLSVNEDIGIKIDSKYFYGCKYSEYNIDEIIKNFIDKNSKRKLSERFNMYLSNSQLKYLEKISKDKDMNTSEYIRLLIDRDRNV